MYKFDDLRSTSRYPGDDVPGLGKIRSFQLPRFARPEQMEGHKAEEGALATQDVDLAAGQMPAGNARDLSAKPSR